MPNSFLSRIREAFYSNQGLKVAALVLAVVSWFAIRKAISFETVVRDVPMEILVDDGWAILDRSVNSVDVLFSGSREGIIALSRDHLEVEIDIQGRAFEGSASITIEPEDVRGVIGGVRPIQVEPNTLMLSLDREEGAQVPVKVDFTDDPPPGYEVEKVVCTPASVTIFGPRERLKEIDSVRTELVSLQGRTGSFDLRMVLQPPSERWVARMEPDTVVVDVSLVERSSTKQLSDVRVNALISSELSPNVRLFPNRISVVLSGRADLVEELERSDIRAYVDCSGLDPATDYKLPIQVHVPMGLEVSEIVPEVVDVETGDL